MGKKEEAPKVCSRCKNTKVMRLKCECGGFPLNEFYDAERTLRKTCWQCNGVGEYDDTCFFC